MINCTLNDIGMYISYSDTAEYPIQFKKRFELRYFQNDYYYIRKVCTHTRAQLIDRS